MAYDSSKPTNTEFLADFPPEMREQLRAIIQDAIVDSGLLNGLKSGNLAGNIPVSNGTLNINLNADMLDGNDSTAFANASHDHNVATTVKNGFMVNTDKIKIDTVSTGAEVNQMAFSNIVIGSTTIQADGKTDTFELAAGTNIALTPDVINDKVTISINGIVANATNAAIAATCTGNATTATNATNHIALAISAHTASAITNVASGNISSLNVQAAIDELDSEKVNISDIVAVKTASKILKLNSDGNLPTDIIGNATTATSFADSKNSNSFAPSGYGLGTTLPETMIKDNMPVSCFTVVSPSSDPWALITSAMDSNNFAQITQQISGNGIWARTKYKGTQNAWKQLATVDQIFGISSSGSGSGYYWRKWTNGDIEQWFTTGSINANNGYTVTFPIGFSSNVHYVNYIMVNCNRFSGGQSNPTVASISLNNFLMESGTDANEQYFVYAKGC